jgi:hypothetical protein
MDGTELTPSQAAAWEMFTKMQAAGNTPEVCLLMALAAATAHIRATERQRIRELAGQVKATCPDMRESRQKLFRQARRPFTDMLAGP